jgi:hypothetical protein
MAEEPTVTGAHLEAAGFGRALWVPSPEKWYLRPGGLSICPEHVAIEEVAEMLKEHDR